MKILKLCQEKVKSGNISSQQGHIKGCMSKINDFFVFQKINDVRSMILSQKEKKIRNDIIDGFVLVPLYNVFYFFHEKKFR